MLHVLWKLPSFNFCNIMVSCYIDLWRLVFICLDIFVSSMFFNLLRNVLTNKTNGGKSPIIQRPH